MRQIRVLLLARCISARKTAECAAMQPQGIPSLGALIGFCNVLRRISFARAGGPETGGEYWPFSRGKRRQRHNTRSFRSYSLPSTVRIGRQFGSSYWLCFSFSSRGSATIAKNRKGLHVARDGRLIVNAGSSWHAESGKGNVQDLFVIRFRNTGHS